MKRLLTLVLAVIMAVGLIACKSAAPAPSSPGASSKSQEKPKSDYPKKAIEIVVPASPGGDTDTTSRSISVPMAKILGQPVAVKNVAGGSGTIAMNEVKTSPADGYKAVYFHADFVLATLLKRVDYRWDEAFEIAAIPGGGSSNVIFVRKDSPFNSMKELIDYAKANPKKLSFAMETGGLVHMLILDIEQKGGVEFNKVDLGGSAARVAALLGKQVDIVLTVYGSATDYVKNGDFKCLGVLADKRNPSIQEVPTLKENGLDITYEHFYFFGFPKGTPKDVIDTFASAVSESTKDTEYQKVMSKYFFAPNFKKGEDALKFMRSVEERFRPLAEKMLSQKK